MRLIFNLTYYQAKHSYSEFFKLGSSYNLFLFFPHKMRSRAQMKQIAKFVPFLIFYLLFWEGILAFFMLSKKVSMHCHHIDKITVKTVIISRFNPHPDTSWQMPLSLTSLLSKCPPPGPSGLYHSYTLISFINFITHSDMNHIKLIYKWYSMVLCFPTNLRYKVSIITFFDIFTIFYTEGSRFEPSK